MAIRKKCLVDTSVIIALLRKNEHAKEVLDSIRQDDAFVCDITILEILAGCSSVEKRDLAERTLEVYGQLASNEVISIKAIQLMKRYCIRKPEQPSLLLPDCLIASYALFYDLELLTFNKKDFAYIQGIKIHHLSR
jgi:predicted nucleic acid-binding protein